ncbi:MAG: hypothetical protein ACOX0F_11105 [Syntrophomonadaceae bacterium]|jgi:hypothetical protein
MDDGAELARVLLNCHQVVQIHADADVGSRIYTETMQKEASTMKTDPYATGFPSLQLHPDI